MLNVLQEYTAFSPRILREQTEAGVEKIIMKGVLQKADTVNQNGRIYPRVVLEREVRNYQKFINERRALGELDHPACVPPGTEIFTSNGWKTIESISKDEVVATLDIDTEEIRFERILNRIDEPYSGPMYRFKNARTYDMMVTPNHRVLIWNRAGKPEYISAERMYSLWDDRSSWLSHSGLRRAGKWKGIEPAAFVIPEVIGKTGRHASSSEVHVDIELWAAFLGIWLAEGSTQGSVSRNVYSNHVSIAQKKSDTWAEIAELLEKIPLDFKKNESGFRINHAGLFNALSSLGNSHTKYIPEYAKQWSPRLLRIMLDWMLKGDGRNRTGYDGLINEYATVSPRLADDVYEIMLKLGSGASIHTYEPIDRPAPDFDETGRMILAENSSPMNIIYEHTTAGISLDWRFMKAEVVDYDGRVYCVETPSGNWLMRYNGKVCWTGNSSVVELKNVSHVVTEARMDDDVVVGTIEVLPTPAGDTLRKLVESDVKLGISSRGVGSTKDRGDHVIVQDDFQLICWDIVAEPSTPGAFIMREGRELSKTEFLGLQNHFRRSDRIFRLCNDILTK